MGQTQRGVLHFPRFFAEDGAQQFFFRAQFLLALGRDLADQDVVGAYLGADPDDSFFIEVLERVLGHDGNVVGDFFRPQLRVAGLEFVFLDMNAGELVVPQQVFANQQGVFVVAAIPGKEGRQHVVSERQVAMVGRGTVGDDHAARDTLSLEDHPGADRCRSTGWSDCICADGARATHPRRREW